MGYRLRSVVASAILLVMACAPDIAPAAPVPFRLRAEWVGPACNDTGSLKVTIRNTSRRPLAVPRRAVIPLLFIVEIYRGDFVYRSLGHPYMSAIYDRGYSRRGGFIVLAPGRRYAYSLEMVDEYNLGAFGNDWRKMQREGGQVTVRYAMSYSPELAHPNAYFVSENWAPYIHSNLLDCPGRNAGVAPH